MELKIFSLAAAFILSAGAAGFVQAKQYGMATWWALTLYILVEVCI